jgi:hypothetical protein
MMTDLGGKRNCKRKRADKLNLPLFFTVKLRGPSYIDGVGVGVGVIVGDIVGVAVGVTVGETVGLAVGEGVIVIVGEGEGVIVIVAVGEGVVLPPPATQANAPVKIVVSPFLTVIVVPSEIPVAESTLSCPLPFFGIVISPTLVSPTTTDNVVPAATLTERSITIKLLLFLSLYCAVPVGVLPLISAPVKSARNGPFGQSAIILFACIVS